MLSAPNRMVDSQEFVETTRKGARQGNRNLVVSVLVQPLEPGSEFKRVGFVVRKRQIPKAVDRNKVKRRLRHLMRERISFLPGGSRVVVRAMTSSLELDYGQLGQSLDRALWPALRQAVEKARFSRDN